jgi:ABC-type transport system involved in multi-copper enzyme maturation permease subunit
MTDYSINILGLDWFTGPILTKELRIAARQRRTYVIRSIYLLLLIIILILAVLRTSLMASGGTAIYRISRMAEIAKSLTLSITWFQFYVAQILAVVLMSNAVNDEKRRGTLDVLMATPISSFQIIVGKLLSKLFQLILFLALSLPMLAIIRVFGAVQWDYIVASLCITFTAMLLAASLSMYFSTIISRPYKVILIMLLILFTFYILIQLQFSLFAAGITTARFLALISPATAMMQVSISAFPTMGIAKTAFSWPAHCLIITIISLVFMAISILTIRRTFRQPTVVNYREKLAGLKRDKVAARPVRPVGESPVFWKELPHSFGTSICLNILIFCTLALILVILCVVNEFGIGFLFHMYGMALWMIASVRTATMAATAITKEKEARTLQVLLGTLIDDEKIIRGKALAILWRNLPVWIILVIHSVISFFGYMYEDFWYLPASLIGTIAWLVILLGLGFYFSVRLKSSTAAVLSTIGGVFTLFILQNYILPIAMMSMSGTAMPGSYMVMIVFQYLFLSVPAGLVLLWLAKCRLRRNIF